MIEIAMIQDGEFLIPERELTKEEKLTISSSFGDGIRTIHYQNDEEDYGS